MANYQPSSEFVHEQIQRQTDDLIAIGKKEQALESLHDLITNPKRRGNWSIKFEKIMNTFINLCLELKEPGKIKEAINQYRHMSQHANIASLENVIKYYRDETEKMFERKNISQSLSSVSDIEAESSAEELFLFSINLDAKRSQDELKSSLNLIWSCYKNIFEIVRLNNKLTDVLASTLKKAFEFCFKFKRINEFKRLSNELRNYLSKMVKSQGQIDYSKNQFAVDITQKTINDRYSEIYIEQLKTCISLELWQDAFRTIKDLHEIIRVRRDQVQIKILSEYFEKLSVIFWKSKYYLYHGQSFHSFYNIFKKGFKGSDQIIQNITDKLVLSMLSIPPVQIENDLKPDIQDSICSLISSSGVVPNRNEMIKVTKPLLDLSSNCVKELFWLLERDFNMMTFQKIAQKLLDEVQQLDPSYVQFVKPIQNNLLYKTIKSASQVFKTIKFDSLNKILNFASPSEIEQTIYSAQSHQYINVKFNHEKKIIQFNDDKRNSNVLIDASQQITQYAQDVKFVAERINKINNQSDAAYQEQKNKFTQQLHHSVQYYLQEARNSVLQRLEKIENLKRPKDGNKFKQALYQEEADKIQKENQERVQREREEQNLQEQIKRQIELKKIQINKKKKIISEILKIKGGPEAKISGTKIANLSDADLEDIDEQTLKQIKDMIDQKSKQSVENKFNRIFQKADYLNRARREEEIKILKQQWDSSSQQIDEIKKIKEEAFEKHEQNQKAKVDLQCVQELKSSTQKSIMDKRKEQFNKKLDEFQQFLLNENYKKQIYDKAIELMNKEQDEEKKKQEEIKQLEQESSTPQAVNWRTTATIIQEKTEEQQRAEEKPATKEFRRGGGQQEETKEQKGGFFRSTQTKETQQEEPKKTTTFITRAPERPSATTSTANTTSQAQTQQSNQSRDLWRKDIGDQTGGVVKKEQPVQKDHVSVSIGSKPAFTRQGGKPNEPQKTTQQQTNKDQPKKEDTSKGGIWRRN